MTDDQKLHFGYFLPDGKGTHSFKVWGSPMPVAMVREFYELTAIVLRLQPLALALAVVEHTHDELVRLPGEQDARLNEGGSPEAAAGIANDLMVESTARLASFLGAAFAFLMQSEREVVHLLGDDAREWNNRRNALHSESFAYRLLYDLRHYSQHYSLPLSGINVQGTRATPDAPMSFKCSMQLKRDSLLSSGFKWGTKREAEIEGLGPDIDILPLSAEYLRCLRVLLLDIADALSVKLLACHEYFLGLRSAFRVPENARMILFFGQADGAEMPMGKGMSVPDDQLRWLFRTLEAARAVDP